MLLKDIKPFVRQALIVELARNNKIDVYNELRSRDCRLFYILSDKGAIRIGRREYPLTYGSVILLMAGTRYTWLADERDAIKFIAVNFDYTHSHAHIVKSIHPIHSAHFSDSDILETVVFEDATVLNRPVVKERISTFEYRIKLLLTEFSMGNRYKDELTGSLLTSLIVSIAQEDGVRTRKKGENYKLTRQVIEYVQNNYSSPLTNVDIARRFSLNPVYLNRLFKAGTNMSIHQFLINYRMNVAMMLLRSEDRPIKKVAQMVGYDDPIQFSKIFKAHIGKTPGEYREIGETEQ